MRVAVTGATGFIASYLLEELTQQDIETIAIVRPCLKDSDRTTIIKANQVIELNLDNNLENGYKKIGSPDCLIHLAWSHLDDYQSCYHFETELPRQYQFLKSLISSGLENLVVAGTCFEYGMQSGSLSEKNATQAITAYGFAKDTLRKQLEYLQKNKPFNLTWTRLFYLYGKGQADNTLYSQLKKAVKMKEAVFNMSAGEQLRDYLSVQESAKILVSLTLKKQNIGIINICSGKPISIRSLVENWIIENNWKIKLNLGCYPYPNYEPMAFWGNNNKLINII